MEYKVLLILVLACVMLSGCISQEPAANEVVCNTPYIRFADTCCLDANGNSICDRDEATTTQATTTAPTTTEAVVTTTTTTTVVSTTTLPLSCSDSDGGINYSSKGTTSGYSAGGSPVSRADWCDGDEVVEYYCEGIYLKSNQSNCLLGCSSGACNPLPVINPTFHIPPTFVIATTTTVPSTECSDSDGGQDIYAKGSTSGVWDFYSPNSTSVSTHSDYCRSNYGFINGLPKGVGEYYCNTNGTKSEKYFDCPKGCLDGACVP